LEQLEGQLRIPLPAATQWEVVEEAAELLKPARDELIRQAAQGEVVHNDDTTMRVLRLARERRTNARACSPAASCPPVRAGRSHSTSPGPSMRARTSPMCCGSGPNTRARPFRCLTRLRNVPKLPAGVEILLANCLAHGRRQFVEVAANFPDQCRYVLEMLGQVYGHHAEARERGLTPEERLRFHKELSSPIMEQLHRWLEAQFAERKTEPNSWLGKAIAYLLRHWRPLTLFLRQAGAPLDNNIVERALKRVVLHRKDAELQRHARKLATSPAE
jgi:transposase